MNQWIKGILIASLALIMLGGILAAVGVWIWVGVCLLWGAEYYADSFAETEGIPVQPVSVEQLAATAAWFAQRVNETADQVLRDETGVFAVSTGEIFARAQGLYDGVSRRYPSLAGPQRSPKAAGYSYLMSLTGFTGYIFPFTGESTLNVDCPAVFLPVTVAHEFAHQRGVAPEQEANYVAVRLPELIEKEWLCAADDFNLRRGDEYINLVKCPEADKGIWVKRYDATEDGEDRNGLKITVYGLDELPDDSTEYTYEVYLWVRDSVWGVDSLTNITSEFDDEMKKEWVSGDGHGTDITTQCSSWQTAGYAARYNVYKGLGGNNDTPYIKVSIHIVRDANATEGPATAVTPKEDED